MLYSVHLFTASLLWHTYSAQNSAGQTLLGAIHAPRPYFYNYNTVFPHNYVHVGSVHIIIYKLHNLVFSYRL